MALTADFLNQVQAQGVAVTIFLLNGVKLQGQILSHDDQALLLQRERLTQLVCLHAISTIMPATPLDLS